MTNPFDEREKAFERQYELEEARNFRVVAHATKDLGLWAASKMNMDDEVKKAYIHEILEAALKGPFTEALLPKIAEDFRLKRLRVMPKEIVQEYDDLLDFYRHKEMEPDAEPSQSKEA